MPLEAGGLAGGAGGAFHGGVPPQSSANATEVSVTVAAGAGGAGAGAGAGARPGLLLGVSDGEVFVQPASARARASIFIEPGIRSSRSGAV